MVIPRDELTWPRAASCIHLDVVLCLEHESLLSVGFDFTAGRSKLTEHFQTMSGLLLLQITLSLLVAAVLFFVQPAAGAQEENRLNPSA